VEFRLRAADAFKGDTLAMRMRVEELRPALLDSVACLGRASEWIGTTISFELKTNGKDTVVLFKHSGRKKPVELMHN
jgi:hypothetical protein